MRRRCRSIVAGLLVVAACRGSDAGVESGAAVPLPAPTTITVAPSADASEPPPTRPAGTPWPGAPNYGLGDPEFPDLGAPGLDVLSYDVHLVYDPATGELSGDERLDVALTMPGPELSLDAGPELDIGEVSVDGAAAPFRSVEDDLVITPASPLVAGDRLELTVTWTTTPKPGSGADGLPLGWFPTDDGSFVLDEPNGLHTWMPANDHPSDKATWRLTIDVPTGYTAVANGTLAEHRVLDGLERWVWAPTEPMATYLVLVLTGRFDLVDGEGVPGVTVQHAVLSADRERLTAVMDVTDDMLRFFAERFGPFPFDTYGLAVTAAVSGLAMENQTRSLFDRGDLLGDGPLDQYRQLLLAHELAHQWFGDAVSPGQWSDTWLNEGFATYGEWMWLEHAGFGSVLSSATTALRTGRRFAPDDPPADALFDPTVYDAGGVVLHALRIEVGDDVFFRILSTWVAEGRFASRTTNDFVTLAARVAGQDLTAFFDDWLFTADPPDAFPS